MAQNSCDNVCNKVLTDQFKEQKFFEIFDKNIPYLDPVTSLVTYGAFAPIALVENVVVTENRTTEEGSCYFGGAVSEPKQATKTDQVALDLASFKNPRIFQNIFGYCSVSNEAYLTATTQEFVVETAPMGLSTFDGAGDCSDFYWAQLPCVNYSDCATGISSQVFDDVVSVTDTTTGTPLVWGVDYQFTFGVGYRVGVVVSEDSPNWTPGGDLTIVSSLTELDTMTIQVPKNLIVGRVDFRVRNYVPCGVSNACQNILMEDIYNDMELDGGYDITYPNCPKEDEVLQPVKLSLTFTSASGAVREMKFSNRTT